MSSRSSKPSVESGDLFVGAEHADKYQSNNWLARKLVNNFMSQVLAAVRSAGSHDVYEAGCGEGHILGLLASNGFRVRGSDVSEEALSIGNLEAARRGLSFETVSKSIYDLDPAVDSADTVLCCEVLEHLQDPEKALHRLVAITRRVLIVSVPNEPLWRILNMARGKYLAQLGNTPGHIQHWSTRRFLRFLAPYANVTSVRHPVPWILVTLRRS